MSEPADRPPSSHRTAAPAPTPAPPATGVSGRWLVLGIFALGGVLYVAGARLWQATWRPGRHDEAIAALEADVRAAPLDPRARAAVDARLDRLRAHPLLGDAWADAAFALDRAGLRAAAIRAYERAEPLRPREFALPYCRGILLVESGRPAAAEAPWARAVLLRPNYVPLRVRLARALLSLERPLDAEHQLLEALKSGRQTAAVELELARARLRLGRAGEAAERLERARRLAPQQLAGADLGSLASLDTELLEDEVRATVLARGE